VKDLERSYDQSHSRQSCATHGCIQANALEEMRGTTNSKEAIDVLVKHAIRHHKLLKSNLAVLKEGLKAAEDDTELDQALTDRCLALIGMYSTCKSSLHDFLNK